MITVGSLFAGIGGIELGLERTGGFKTVWQVEQNRYATKILEKHWPAAKRRFDVRAFCPPSSSPWLLHKWIVDMRAECGVDLICGGFPCQPVSTAGRRKGESDKRWLWGEMRRVCEILKPKWILAENVPGLLSAGNVRGELFGKILRDLATLGYDAEWESVSAASVGAPHIRDRIFILGYARSCGFAGNDRGRARQEFANRRENVANDDSDDSGASGQSKTETGTTRLLVDGSEPIHPDALCKHDDNRRFGASPVFWQQQASTNLRASEQWKFEPNVGRVANGVPSRVDRLTGLGKAVVPQVTELIGRIILEEIALQTEIP